MECGNIQKRKTLFFEEKNNIGSVFDEEVTNTNFIVYGLTRQGLELTIYRTQSKHTYHYSTDEVQI
jgi:hypothetical protein